MKNRFAKMLVTIVISSNLVGCIFGGMVVNTLIHKDTTTVKSEATSELYPCPFCGGKAKLEESCIGKNTAYAECSKCGIRTKSYDCVSMEEAYENTTKAWNKRVME